VDDGDDAERVGALVDQFVVDVLLDPLVGDDLGVGVDLAGALRERCPRTGTST
jgi:hypothetical protein